MPNDVITFFDSLLNCLIRYLTNYVSMCVMAWKSEIFILRSQEFESSDLPAFFFLSLCVTFPAFLRNLFCLIFNTKHKRPTLQI